MCFDNIRKLLNNLLAGQFQPMNNTGKQLEQLVKEIEQLLLPKGFNVSANKNIFNDEGVQVAEFDIEISGQLGSSSIKSLIECRDRPSKGSAPGSWIEQLVGRRSRFKFNKVMAVSTSGFADSAITYAKTEGIDLRSLENLSPKFIADWFLPTHMELFSQNGELTHARLIPEKGINDDIFNSLSEIIVNDLGKKTILVSTETGEKLSIVDAWRGVLNKMTSSFDGLEPNGESKKIAINANYNDENSRYKIITPNGPVHITNIIYVAELSIKTSKIPISRITQYKDVDNKKAISQTVSFEPTIGDKNVTINFHKLKEKGNTVVTIQAQSK